MAFDTVYPAYIVAMGFGGAVAAAEKIPTHGFHPGAAVVVVDLSPFKVVETQVFLSGAANVGVFVAGNVDREVYVAGLAKGQIIR